MPLNWGYLGGLFKGAWNNRASIARSAWNSPMVRTGLMGAGIGGLYGGMTDQGVLGNAMMGAGIGMGGRYGLGLARSAATRTAWNAGAGRGFGSAFLRAGGSMGRQAYTQGISSAALIGSTLRKGYNSFRGIP